MEQIFVQQFVTLKEDTRNKLREIFLIGRSSHAEVITDHMGVGTVVCDGTTNVDLQNLTAEKMRDYLETAAINDSINTLFTQVVEKIEGICAECIAPTPIIEPLSTTKEEIAPQNDLKVESINVNKCPDCEYTHASKQGMRMHILKKHLHK